MAINSVFRERHKKIHLVGIGGIGMSGIARVLIESGFAVTGSDIAESTETKNLVLLGAKIFIGHHEDHLNDADVLVFSSAIKKDNPEILRAQKNNIPIIPRATMLAELMRLRCGIAVSGAHGKTTTTSLIGTIMHKVGLDPTVIIGGVVNHFGSNAVVGKSQFMVTEADESDGTFLHLTPTIAVVTNIDEEHLDFYQGGLSEIKEKFIEFLNALPFYGLAVVCIDDPNVLSILPLINRRVVTYGVTPGAMYRASNVVNQGLSTSFDLLVNEKFIETFTINMVGEHNVLNSLATIAVLEEIGVFASTLRSVINNFSGIRRRFMPVGHMDSFCVIDDYAHHPTEIRAVLKAARAAFDNKKIHVLFQPHRFSRTKDLMGEFACCFEDCDTLVITDIYPAAEKPIVGISTHTLIEHIKLKTNFTAYHVLDINEGAKKIVSLAEKNDVIFTLGAGSITDAAPKIVNLLKIKCGLSG
jgi:UDP-N-acetylmuramate--alanine ligase